MNRFFTQPAYWIAGLIPSIIIAVLIIISLATPSHLTDVSGELALIGGIMGAVFTVGGLVVALSSVLVALTIDTRIRQVFDERLKESEAAINEIAEKRARVVLANEESKRAIFRSDWERAHESIGTVVTLDPTFPSEEKHFGLSLTKSLLADVTSWWYGNTLLELSFPEQSQMHIKWATQALEKARAADYKDGDVLAALAVLYGTVQNFDAMMEALKQLARLDVHYLGSLERTPYLLCFLWACQHNNTTISELLLRGRIDEIKSVLHLRSFNSERVAKFYNPSSRNEYWLAIRNEEFWKIQPDGDSPAFLVPVRVRRKDGGIIADYRSKSNQMCEVTAEDRKPMLKDEFAPINSRFTMMFWIADQPNLDSGPFNVSL